MAKGYIAFLRITIIKLSGYLFVRKILIDGEIYLLEIHLSDHNDLVARAGEIGMKMTC